MGEIRFSVDGDGKNSLLGGAIERAIMATGGWSIPALREPGFRAMEAIAEAERTLGFRAAAPLQDKAQVAIDRAVVEVGLQRLTFVADLLAEGLTYPLTDAMSITQLEWSRRSRTGAAQRTMNPSSRGENKLPAVLNTRLPIYITMDQFDLDIRTLKASERVGTPLDTALIKDCTRSVNEGLEDAGINGATTLDGQPLQDSGYLAPGLLNAPNANTYPLSVNWCGANTPGTTGPAILNDVQGMVAAAQADRKFGPYNLYVSTVASNVLDGDYKGVNGGDVTIRQRLEQMVYGGRNLRIRSADFLPSAATGVQAVLVQMTSDVVDIVTGQSPTVIPWTSLDGFIIHNIVLAIQVPRVKWDYDGNSGIVIGSKA